MDLRNARVVITGASRGIGEALAVEFADAGSALTLIARTAADLEEVAKRSGGLALAGDLTDAGFRSDAVAAIEDDGAIDVWINNAGYATHGPFVDSERQDITAVLDVNLHAPIQLCRLVLPGMLERGAGHIVNVSSMAMAVNTPLFATYGASKSGLSAFSESLRLELGGSGVGLTLVEIGETDTAMLQKLREDAAIDSMYRRFEVMRMQRMIEPAEVAEAVRHAVENGRPHVRLPRRAALLPKIVNLPRSLGNIAQRGT